MNLPNEYKTSFITVCFAVAVIYAFILNGALSVSFRLVDGLVYGSLLCITGFVLWNIFRFALPANRIFTYRLLLLVGLPLFTGLFTIGLEAAVLYLCFPSAFQHYLPTLPVRLFITFLLFIIFGLFYLIFSRQEDTTPLPSAAESTINSSPIQEVSAQPNVDSASSTPPEAPLSTDRITVRSGSRIKIIPIDEICYIKADGDYISIHTSEGNWLKEQTMKHTEKMLPTDCFVRIHRSYIVNIHHISRIERYGEKQQVVLHNQEKIKISAARYRILKQILGI